MSSHDEFSRARFLAVLAAAQAAFLPLAAGAQTPPAPDDTKEELKEILHERRRNRRALVLSGGGARGAYQAGIIQAMVNARGIKDGQILAPYGLVCGTSIGALNAYIVATGQYNTLREMWWNVGNQNVVRLKRQYRDITDPNSGVGNRIAQAIGLALGVKSDAKGVLDASRVRDWLARNIDTTLPVLMPVIWTVTNLSEQQPEFFYRVPQALTQAEHDLAVQAIRETVGPRTAVREATPDLLIDSLQASASIPLAFDPAVLPAPGGGVAQYVDGGVTANTPIGVARAFAANVDVVLMDPQFEAETYKNALEIGIGVFGTMQQRILDSDVRAAMFETFGKRALDQLPRSILEKITNGSEAAYDSFQDFLNAMYATDFFVKRPDKVLPVEVVGFNDFKDLLATWEIGYKAGLEPFAPYDYKRDA
jgi:predicted acylesterase/phospholipase RssA